MRAMEEYVELVERDSKDIAGCWKNIPMFLYFVCAMSGYFSTIVFYTYWQSIFDGQCPFWASVRQLPQNSYDHDPGDPHIVERMNNTDWRWNVIISQEYNSHCNVYFITMFCSCFLGTVWLTFFYMCGRGGYDGFVAPWKLVCPAMLCNLVFAIIMVYIAHSISSGYAMFASELEKHYYRLTNAEILRSYNERCNIIQYYIQVYKGNKYNVCKTVLYIKILVWVMGASWTGATIVLLLRILSAADFKIVKVTAYKKRSDETLTSVSSDDNRTKTSNREQKMKHR